MCITVLCPSTERCVNNCESINSKKKSIEDWEDQPDLKNLLQRQIDDAKCGNVTHEERYCCNEEEVFGKYNLTS